MSQEFRAMVGQMNTSLAGFVVTGTGNFRQLAIGAEEKFVEMAIQYAESKLLMRAIDSSWLADALAALGIHIATHSAAMAVEAASSTAAGAAAALASVPFPANLAAAATVTTLGDAFTMEAGIAERGALLPSREMMIHTHPEEMILPQHISNFIVNAASNASGGRNAQHHYHGVYAPSFNVVDSKGVAKLLDDHEDVFHSKMRSMMRRRNY